MLGKLIRTAGAAKHRISYRFSPAGRPANQRAVFVNWEAFVHALRHTDDGETILQTRTGVEILIRNNRYDAMIVGEQFIGRDYLRHFVPPEDRAAVIVDIGGYIGDFSLWCASELDAEVVVYEPAAENWAVLTRNLELNPALANRIRAVHRGVASTDELEANVVVHGNEVHVSSQWYDADPSAERRTFACDTLEAIVAEAGGSVDLLKVDCEGAEYDIFEGATAEVYRACSAIVFERHRVSDWQRRLAAITTAMAGTGMHIRRRGHLVYAWRP